MQAHQDAKLSTDQPIIEPYLEVGQWIKFTPGSQPDKDSYQSQKMNDRIFLVYARDAVESFRFLPLTYKLIDSGGKRYYYYPLQNKLDAEDVRLFDIFLIPPEKAKKICGNAGLQAINKVLQLQLPQDAYERARKHYPPIQTINRFVFQDEVAEFIKLQENHEEHSQKAPDTEKKHETQETISKLITTSWERSGIIISPPHSATDLPNTQKSTKPIDNDIDNKHKDSRFRSYSCAIL